MVTLSQLHACKGHVGANGLRENLQVKAGETLNSACAKITD